MDIFEKGCIAYFADVTQDTLDEKVKLEPFCQFFSKEHDLLKVGIDERFLHLMWGWGMTDIVPLKHLIRLSVDKENK